jgi:signal transduction histidine kinase
VHDNGPGIRPVDFNKIFQKFTQLPGEPQHSGGAGLGLAISQEFIQSQGGSLWVESSEGKGSTFILSLPLASIS